MVLVIQFRSVKCVVATRIRKNFEQLLIPIQAMQTVSRFKKPNKTDYKPV